jgi:hypothetical protein
MFQISFDRYFKGTFFVSYCDVNFLYVTDTCAVVQENALPSLSPWTRTSLYSNLLSTKKTT